MENIPKLRWVMRKRKFKPMFILQQLIGETDEGTGYWEDVPVVDDGKADEAVKEHSWVTAKIKEFWKARVAAKVGK